MLMPERIITLQACPPHILRSHATHAPHKLEPDIDKSEPMSAAERLCSALTQVISCVSSSLGNNNIPISYVGTY